MGFPILRLFLLLLLLFQLLSPFAQQGNPLLTGSDKQQDIHQRIQGKVSINKRGGGGGGGHGGFGGHISGQGGRGRGGKNHGHSNGDKSPYTQGGSVIPLYAAGGAKHHRNDHGRHGSNVASRRQCDLNYLLFSILMSLGFVCFI